MKRLFIFLCLAFMLVSFSFCKGKNKKSESSNVDYIAENTDFAVNQYGLMTEMIEDSGKILNPKSFINGKHDESGAAFQCNKIIRGFHFLQHSRQSCRPDDEKSLSPGLRYVACRRLYLIFR
jgi:hypothetical protein